MSVPMGGGYYNPGPQINFDWISQAWNLFKEQMWAWVGAILLFGVVTFAICVPIAFATGYAQTIISLIQRANSGSPPAPPNVFLGNISALLFSAAVYAAIGILQGGLYRMAMRQMRGEIVKSTDVFSALDVALPMLVVGVLTQIALTISVYLCILPVFIVGGLFMFAPLLVVDRGLGPISAISESIALLKGHWLMAALFFLVISFLSGIGGLACWVGALWTYPLLFLTIGLAYRAFTQPVQPTQFPSYGQPQANVWPPPPNI